MFVKIFSNIKKEPEAIAIIEGSREYPDIRGEVLFYQTPYGVLVGTEVTGLPLKKEDCDGSIYAFHIHEGENCTGNAEDPFADTLGHYNPEGCGHPFHEGDMPPLFGNHGLALQFFLTDRFYVEDIIGKTVVIHLGMDDFTTQPSGNAGMKIACGEIREA